MIEKIRTKKSTDNELLVECQSAKNISYGDSNSISWTAPPRGQSITPPTGTIAIVVDVRENKGVIRVYEASSRTHCGNVGLEEAGNLVIIPWNSGWYYSTAGSLPVGHIVAASTVDDC